MKLKKYEVEQLKELMKVARKKAGGPSNDEEIDAYAELKDALETIFAERKQAKKDNRGIALIKSLRKDAKKHFKDSESSNKEKASNAFNMLRCMAYGSTEQEYCFRDFTLAGGGPGVHLEVKEDIEDGEICSITVVASDMSGVYRKELATSDPLYQLGVYLQERR